MKKFSNDPLENVAINALPYFWEDPGHRMIHDDKTTLCYVVKSQKWLWEYRGQHSEYLSWVGNGVKEEIIDFLCKVKPDLAREFLRAKSELDLTKKTISAL